MSDRYTQEILRYAKTNHFYFCARAYSTKDLRNFIRQFFFLMMNRSNVVQFETSANKVIQQLTGWPSQSITNALKQMLADGEIHRMNQKTYIVNDLIANRVKVVKNHNGYPGKQPVFTSDELRVIADIQRLIKNELDHGAADMKKLLNKLDEQSDQLKKQDASISELKNILMEIKTAIQGDDLPKAKTILRLVKNKPQ